MMEVTGFILAGGKSSRMGADKGLVDFRGIPMIQHILTVLESMQLRTVIIANNDDYGKFGVPILKDIVEVKGPVAGIYSALQNSNTEFNLILSCDIPLVSKELLEIMIEESAQSEVTIASYEGREHPLIGIYKKSIATAFKSHLDRDQLKLMKVIDTLDKKVVEFSNADERIDPKIFSNINTKEELTKLEE